MTRSHGQTILLAGVAALLFAGNAHAQFGGLSATERALLLGLGVNRVNNQDFMRTMWALNSMERTRMFQQQQMIRQRMSAQRALNEQNRIRGIMRQTRTPMTSMPVQESATEAESSINSDVLLVWEVFGATFMTANANDVSVVDSRFDGGMRVAAVQVGGPADRAGWESGDILVGMYRYRIRNYDNLAFIAELPDLASINPMKVIFIRNGKLKDGTVDVVNHSAPPTPTTSNPEPEAAAPKPEVTPELRGSVATESKDPKEVDLIWDRLGIRGASSELARSGSEFQKGIAIRAVRPGSPAEQAGWKVGETLVGLADYQTKEMADVAFVLDQPTDDQPIPWVVVHSGGIRKGDIRLPNLSGEAAKSAQEEFVPAERPAGKTP